MTTKPANNAANSTRRFRPAKNFLAVLGRTTLRLGINNQKNLVGRAMGKVRRADDILHRITKLPSRKP